MKKLKALLALVLVLAMCATLLVACAKKDDTKPANSEKPASSDNTETPAETPAETPEEPDEEPDEIAEITLWGFCTGGTVKDTSGVEAALNEILEKKINAHITLNIMDIGEYLQKAALALSAGEDGIDLLVPGFGALGMGAMHANGQLLDLTPYLDTIGQNIKSVCGTYLGAYTISGKVYGVPSIRALNSSCYIGMRKDMLEEMNMLEFAQNMKSWPEYEQLMQAVKDNYENIYPVVMFAEIDGAILCGTNFSDARTFDNCGDNTRLVAGFDNGDIGCVWFDEDRIAQFAMIADWMEKGYAWPDAPYAQTTGGEVIKQGMAFSEPFNSEIGNEANKKAATGYDYLSVKAVDIPLGTANVCKFGLAVNANTKEPEACVKFLDLLYSDKEVITLMTWGIEGKDYVVTDGIADYPADTDATYHLEDYFFGNSFLIVPWNGTSADFREIAKASLEAAPVSPFLGFTFDGTGMEDIIASISAVHEEYVYQLSDGLYTPALIEEAQNKLKAAGIDDYVNAIKDQIAAWKAAN